MIKVIDKALNILELLANEQNKKFQLGEIADTLKMDHGTCANIIKTLAARGYVDYITLNVPPRAFSNVPLQIWSL